MAPIAATATAPMATVSTTSPVLMPRISPNRMEYASVEYPL